MYHYEESKVLEPAQLMSLYGSVGWQAYTEQFDTLQTGLAQSLKVVTVWHEAELVGLIRAVGDGQTIIYIQDLLVKPQHQKQGLGSQLMQKILTEYQQVRQVVLMTEEAPSVRRFYEQNGFKSCDQGQVVAFAIFK